MKKYLSVLYLLPLVVGYAHAVDSTITITGYLKEKDNTCSVSVDSQDFTVDLQNNAAKQFRQVGDVTPSIPFKIVFNECGSAAKAVRVGYVGTADSSNTALLKIDAGTNAANGIGIQILDRDEAPLPLNAARDALKWTTLTAGQSNTVGFYARMMSTRSPVTAGTVTATASFTLEFQ